MNDNVMGLPGSRPENLSHIIQERAGDNYLPFVNCQWRMETEESLKEELKESRKSVGWLVLLWMPIKIWKRWMVSRTRKKWKDAKRVGKSATRNFGMRNNSIKELILRLIWPAELLIDIKICIKHRRYQKVFNKDDWSVSGITLIVVIIWLQKIRGTGSPPTVKTENICFLKNTEAHLLMTW